MYHAGLVARAISVRLDDEADKALRMLESTGLTQSEAIRVSLLGEVRRRCRSKELAAEVAALEADEQDREEMLAIAALAAEFLPRSVVIVAPTSRSARAASFRPEAEIAGATTRVLVEQIGVVDGRRLGELAGHLSDEEMWGIDEALVAVLGLR